MTYNHALRSLRRRTTFRPPWMMHRFFCRHVCRGHSLVRFEWLPGMKRRIAYLASIIDPHYDGDPFPAIAIAHGSTRINPP